METPSESLTPPKPSQCRKRRSNVSQELCLSACKRVSSSSEYLALYSSSRPVNTAQWIAGSIMSMCSTIARCHTILLRHQTDGEPMLRRGHLSTSQLPRTECNGTENALTVFRRENIEFAAINVTVWPNFLLTRRGFCKWNGFFKSWSGRSQYMSSLVAHASASRFALLTFNSTHAIIKRLHIPLEEHYLIFDRPKEECFCPCAFFGVLQNVSIGAWDPLLCYRCDIVPSLSRLNDFFHFETHVSITSTISTSRIGKWTFHRHLSQQHSQGHLQRVI